MGTWPRPLQLMPPPALWNALRCFPRKGIHRRGVSKQEEEQGGTRWKPRDGMSASYTPAIDGSVASCQASGCKSRPASQCRGFLGPTFKEERGSSGDGGRGWWVTLIPGARPPGPCAEGWDGGCRVHVRGPAGGHSGGGTCVSPLLWPALSSASWGRRRDTLLGGQQPAVCSR